MKVTPSAGKSSTVTFKTKDAKADGKVATWWKTKDKNLRAAEVLTTAAYLKDSQGFRYRQAAMYARLYGNMSLFSFAGSSLNKIDQTGLPADRPTFNIVQSATDTLVSRIAQSRPAPVFLTDNSDYKERNLAKKLNNFIQGELYQTKAYDKGTVMLRDALVEGTGCLKVYRTQDDKVGLDRVLLTELLTDPSEGMYGEPRRLYQLKLIDRDVLLEMFPDFKAKIQVAERAYPDNSAESSKAVSDLVMVVEAWSLPSGKDAGDGRHVISCSSGSLLDEEYTKDKFPFVFLQYSPRLLGFWAQGLAEQLMGTQMEINSLLYTISKAIKLVGVPRVFVEDGSKVTKTHLNNEVGTIVTYRGTKPEYSVAQCVPQELYAQLQRLIDYGYQQCGVSAMQASSNKPAGLNSGEAIRSYDDISSDRFNSLSRRYDNMYIDLAYQIIDCAKDIAEDTGSYQTVYPHKNGTKEIDLPNVKLLQDPFVIQCFNMSSLPRDPAGRIATITEWMQAGIITLKEGRRLMDFPDLSQVEILANAAEERIFQQLDDIIEEGKYSPPDPFTDLELAKQHVVEYINLYASAKLEEEKMEMLRTYYNQVLAMGQAAMPPAPAPGMPGAAPQAVPEAPPVSQLLPNAPATAA